jgi:hypothetical protein
MVLGPKALDDFDSSFGPSVGKRQVVELTTGRVLRERPPGPHPTGPGGAGPAGSPRIVGRPSGCRRRHRLCPGGSDRSRGGAGPPAGRARDGLRRASGRDRLRTADRTLSASTADRCRHNPIHRGKGYVPCSRCNPPRRRGEKCRPRKFFRKFLYPDDIGRCADERRGFRRRCIHVFANLRHPVYRGTSLRERGHRRLPIRRRCDEAATSSPLPSLCPSRACRPAPPRAENRECGIGARWGHPPRDHERPCLSPIPRP